jgi:hypothetical protein
MRKVVLTVVVSSDLHIQRQMKVGRQIRRQSQYYAVNLKLVYILWIHLIMKAAKKAEEIRRKARDNNRGNMFSLKELDWFSQNVYNCAVGGCESWENNQIVSVADSCLKVCLPISDNLITIVPNDVSKRYGS